MFKELWIKNKVNVELLKEILHILKVWIEKFQYVNKKSDSLSSILWIIYYDRFKNYRLWWEFKNKFHYIFKLNNKHHLNMNRPGTSISKAKVTKTSGDDVGMKKVAQEKLPTLQDYLSSRDWIGAIALL